MDEKARWRAAYRSVDAAQQQLHAHFKNGPAGKSEAGRALLGEHQKAIRRWRDDLGSKSPALKRLSRRERQVLKFVVEGELDNEIATLLRVAPKSVESYRRRMMDKLGIEDLPSLVKFAIRNGITPL